MARHAGPIVSPALHAPGLRKAVGRVVIRFPGREREIVCTIPCQWPVAMPVLPYAASVIDIEKSRESRKL